MQQVKECGIDLILAGHLHKGYHEINQESNMEGGGPIILQAGTAISRRTRNEPNNYNIINFSKNKIQITKRAYEPGHFRYLSSDRYAKIAMKWGQEHV